MMPDPADQNSPRSLPEFDEQTGRKIVPKSELLHGHYYGGRCRNAAIARWNEEENCFYHWRQKFGNIFLETIRHPADDERFDVFRVIRELAYPKFEIPFRLDGNFTGRREDLDEHTDEVWRP